MVGIGYRKEFTSQFLQENLLQPDFIEVAPENWMGIGGFWKQQFDKVKEKYPLYCHGLSLSIGSPEPLDIDFIKKVKTFLDQNEVVLYSEHLSFSKVDNAHLYDLLPIPFTKAAVNNVVKKIKIAQDILGRKLILENASYYTVLAREMEEAEFINEIVSKSDCELLLDVNNVYVNAHNHSYNAQDFISKLPLEKVSYIHMAGHLQVSDDLIIDTHGEKIIDPVYDLLNFTMRNLKRDVPVLLERDFNIPQLSELQEEIDTIRNIKSSALKSIEEYATI
jgi:hypothetical protein